MHTCDLCGQACYCDMEDHENPMPADCSHLCADDPDDGDDWYEVPGEPYAPDTGVPGRAEAPCP